jgi:hypothetical protein
MGLIREDINDLQEGLGELEEGVTEDITDIREEIRQLRELALSLDEQLGEMKKENKILQDKLTFMQCTPVVHHCYHPPQVTYYMQPQPYYGAVGYNTTYQISSGSYSA